jgi:twitching motility protein PilU
MSTGNMERVLRLMSEKGASDVYLSASSPILIKINGQLLQLSDQPLTHAQPRQLLAELLTPSQLEELEDTGELNVGVGLSGIGSFRLSGFKQRGSIAAVFRCIPFEIPSLESLNVPPILSQLVLEKRGLILMVGATGAGKSTTLASMLEQRNQQMAGHILTIEDPIEFLFNNKKSVVNQREVGRDTQTLQVGLRNALRQAPDCIMVGEIRDRETAQIAIESALTGHLVLSTLHTNDAPGAITRLIEMGIEPFLVGSAVDCVVAQRLARLLCEECKRRTTISSDVMRMNGFNVGLDLEAYEPVGCARCGGSGYKGRIGLYEVMWVSETIRSLAVAREPAETIAHAAVHEGMMRLREDGLEKVRRGLTSIAEIARVAGTR